MANHIVIEAKAKKLTTHEPDDFDESYIAWIKVNVEDKLRDMKFRTFDVQVRVEADA